MDFGFLLIVFVNMGTDKLAVTPIRLANVSGYRRVFASGTLGCSASLP